MSVSLDTSELRKSIKRLADAAHQELAEVCATGARGFVKDVVMVTPPSNGQTKGSAAKKAGEMTIANDLRRIFTPLTGPALQAVEDFYGREQRQQFGHKGAKALGEVVTKVLRPGDMQGWHQERRRKDGRVMNVHRQVATGLRKRDLRGLDQGLVAQEDYKAYLRKIHARVGLLASGWNTAAQKLGVKLPAWVMRHGTTRGQYVMVSTSRLTRIEVSNAVPFVGEVRGLERRMNWAIKNQVQKMDRKADFLLRQAIRKAGF